MAGPVTFHELIEALANAVIEAQQRIEHHQVVSVKAHLDSKGHPKALDLYVPSLRLDAKENEEDLLRVPHLTLIKRSHLTIKEVEIDFDVDLVEFGSPETDGEGEQKNALSVDMFAGRAGKKGAAAHVKLRVEGQEPSEGTARLLDELIKRIQVLPAN